MLPGDIQALNEGLDLPARIPRDFLDVQDAAALTIPRHVWIAGYRGLIEAVPPTEIGTIRVPTLVLSGADDELLGSAAAAELAASIPGSRHRAYPKTSHFVLWEHPDWVARDVVRFVTEPEALDVADVAPHS